METPQVYQFGSDNNGWNNAWPLFANGGFNNGIFGGGLGSGFIGGIFGGLLSNIFGWGNGGFGGNGNGAAAALGAQAQNNNNTDLLMNAITSTGAQQTQAIQALSAALGQDFNLVNSQIGAITTTLNQMAIQNATTPLQVINAINSGNAALQAQFAQCCCENRLAICQQTNEINGTINTQGQRQVDAIADLKATMIQEFCAARERDMQAKIDTQADIITQQRGQIDNASQTNQIIGYVNSVIAPLQKAVTEIADKQLPTVPVQWPQIQAVNTTPYMGGLYGNGFGGNIVF